MRGRQTNLSDQPPAATAVARNRTGDAVKVRAALNSDRDTLALLQWRWRVEEWGGEPRLSLADFRRDFAAWAAAHGASHLPFVAEEGDDAVGMAWLAVTERVPTPARWERLGGSLQSVYVTPLLRNAGVGEALVRAVIERAALLGLDYLMVHPSERSFPFYRRIGFAETGRYLELVIDLRERAQRRVG